jgi:hypothetical protein
MTPTVKISKKKIKESPDQQSIFVKCCECKKGYFGNKSCSSGMFARSKTSNLCCWHGELLSGDLINATT